MLNKLNETGTVESGAFFIGISALFYWPHKDVGDKYIYSSVFFILAGQQIPLHETRSGPF
ncbi:MAG TPA: hypothetical protein VIM75_01420 [Ohtaekwangia sp.]|uniref:hypothetical protein n=1 Tax=Ohtaekwangia sp. TaxID=2066019 RepID=UPI002F950058